MSMDVGQLAESHRRDAERRLAGYQRLGAAIERLAVTARSPDGGVQVTVRAGGTVSDVTLSEAALCQGADRLGRLVQATIRQAQGSLVARLARRARACLGDRFDVVDVVGVVHGTPPPAGQPQPGRPQRGRAGKEPAGAGEPVRAPVAAGRAAGRPAAGRAR